MPLDVERPEEDLTLDVCAFASRIFTFLRVAGSFEKTRFRRRPATELRLAADLEAGGYRTLVGGRIGSAPAAMQGADQPQRSRGQQQERRRFGDGFGIGVAW